MLNDLPEATKASDGKKIEVFFYLSCHSLKAALCDLGDPGWGNLWFPHSTVLLHSNNGVAL